VYNTLAGLDGASLWRYAWASLIPFGVRPFHFGDKFNEDQWSKLKKEVEFVLSTEANFLCLSEIPEI